MKYCKIPTFKYRLLEDEITALSKAFFGYTVFTDFIILKDGVLTLKRGYSWDGASGPAIDTKNNMRSSLVHDALCQLIWSGRIPESRQIDADKEFRRICIEDGMSKIRANIDYIGLRLYAVTFKRNPAEPRVFEV